ncbi:MAG: hypothetical protein EXS48_03540 [Candidatus Staskawiczbacteria bacterium]|nr:hypothetical protein [Candidatus Staskawiczbacteria bacterium]
MSTAILRLHYKTATHKIKNKISAVAAVRINWKAVYSAAFLFCLAMLAWYIVMVNQLTKGAYLIKSYNKDIRTLTTENKVLEAGFAESEFFGKVGLKARKLSFEKTTNVIYLQLLQNSLAEAK